MSLTCLIDIDGTLIEQVDNYMEHVANNRPLIVPPGTLQKLKEWERKGYRIILTTARKEGSRRITEDQLGKLGIFYDQLVMGCNVGPRVLINDLKPGYEDIPMAIAINLPRNKGIGDIEI